MERNKRRRDYDHYDKKSNRESKKPRTEDLERKIKNFIKDYQLNLPWEEIAKMLVDNSETDLCYAISNLIRDRYIGFPYRKYFMLDLKTTFDNLRNYKQNFRWDESYEIPSLVEHTNLLRQKPVCEVKPASNLSEDSVKLKLPTSGDSGVSDGSTFCFKGRPLLWPSEQSDYENVNAISDHFIERARIMSVAGYNRQSTYDYWRKSRGSPPWLIDLIKNKKNLNTYEMREALYKFCKSEPSTFKPSVSKAIIQFFKSKRILDFCAGWGDRLAGAIASEDDIDYYYGVDPNSEIFSGYDSMIKSLAKDPEKFRMFNHPFETLQFSQYSSKNNNNNNNNKDDNCEEKVTDPQFDLVFTGPPYFDYEKYGDGKNQSISSFPEFSDWMNKFLFSSISKSWDMLVEDGILAINIGDTKVSTMKGYYYTECMNLFIQSSLMNATYLGVICFTGGNYIAPRPIWIYKKEKVPSYLDENDRERRKMEARSAFKKFYSNVYQKKKGDDE
eukprot:TRINITY_DN3459_c0_g1_i1.p1 TRINITY_DN3459_c0_g1~~TRINITY_DN3459_c0_g1_i1.p1  ORF type:complete len:500 (-),score=80.14 TRINITY_DN3459_c0_g1_i1:15-1514(-)